MRSRVGCTCEDAQANEFQERLDQLKAMGDRMFFRMSVLKARPTACGSARLYLTELQNVSSQYDMHVCT
ncbi:hypothetical protein ZWY2020_010083 [Hordeum vulgare]|nr:hypothetical protein ZWY2020_010083 [Hordeum vulgare]